MVKRNNPTCACIFDDFLEIVCRKWSLRIINEIGNHGKLRHRDLMSELKGISPSTLSLVLKQLQKEKIIKRKSFDEAQLRTEYSLLPRGKKLQNAMIPILKWAKGKAQHVDDCSCSLE